MTQDAVVEEELDHFEENGGTGAAPAGAPAMGCMGLGTGSFETARGRWSAPGQLGGPRFELWEVEKQGQTGVSERFEVRSSANEIFMGAIEVSRGSERLRTSAPRRLKQFHALDALRSRQDFSP